MKRNNQIVFVLLTWCNDCQTKNTMFYRTECKKKRKSYNVYRLSYHVVFVCKYRRCVLKPVVVDYIKK